MPSNTKTAETTHTKASKIHDPMLTLQRLIAYIVLFVLCFVCPVSYTHLTLPTSYGV